MISAQDSDNRRSRLFKILSSDQEALVSSNAIWKAWLLRPCSDSVAIQFCRMKNFLFCNSCNNSDLHALFFALCLYL